MEFNPNLRITRKADRVEAAKSFEDNEGFREYVMDTLEKWLANPRRRKNLRSWSL